MKSTDCSNRKSPQPRCLWGASSIPDSGELQIPLPLPLRGFSKSSLLPPGQTLHPVRGNLVQNLVNPRLFGLLRGGSFLGFLDGPAAEPAALGSRRFFRSSKIERHALNLIQLVRIHLSK